MIAMPIAGRLTDKTGVGRIVPAGLVIVALSFARPDPAAAATRPTGCSAPCCSCMGLGMGFDDDADVLRRDADAAPVRRSPARSTTLNIIQQVGASIGTAVMSVILTAALHGPLPAAAAAGGTGSAPVGRRTCRAQVARPDGRARSAHTFWWALALIVPSRSSSRSLLPTPQAGADRGLRRRRRACADARIGESAKRFAKRPRMAPAEPAAAMARQALASGHALRRHHPRRHHPVRRRRPGRCRRAEGEHRGADRGRRARLRRHRHDGRGRRARRARSARGGRARSSRPPTAACRSSVGVSVRHRRRRRSTTPPTRPTAGAGARHVPAAARLPRRRGRGRRLLRRASPPAACR